MHDMYCDQWLAAETDAGQNLQPASWLWVSRCELQKWACTMAFSCFFLSMSFDKEGAEGCGTSRSFTCHLWCCAWSLIISLVQLEPAAFLALPILASFTVCFPQFWRKQCDRHARRWVRAAHVLYIKERAILGFTFIFAVTLEWQELSRGYEFSWFSI